LSEALVRLLAHQPEAGALDLREARSEF